MSYTVLSRKYRPQIFDDVVGQQHVTRTLENAIRIDRVAHSYIFSGPRGVGKTTTARILAKALNCLQNKDNNPCGECRNCSEITGGRSLDVQELDGASNRGIDEIRELREAIKYPPNSSKYRIYIIDEVHMLTKEAFNALLKTLEEPPPHAIFMMATTDPHKVPQTILSRTQRFDFKRVSVKNIVSHLENILTFEKIESSFSALELIAVKADGSLRDSLSLLDQVIAYSDNNLDDEIVRDALGVIHDSLFLSLLKCISNGSKSEILSTLNDVIDSGYAISDLISGFNNFLRDCLSLKVGQDANTHFSKESLDWVVSSNCTLSDTDFLRILEMVLQFEAKLKYVQQPRIALDSLFIKLASMDTSVTITRVLSGQETLDAKSKPNVKPVQTPTQIAPPKTPKVAKVKEEVGNVNVSPKPVELKLTDFTEKWDEILAGIETVNSKIIHFLDGAVVKDYKNSTLFIELEDGHSFQIKSLEKDNDKIEKILSTIFGAKMFVKYTVKQTSNSTSTEEKKSEEQDHPLLMKVLETFEGEILR
jgi:DNA polymerase-3 subunit gamma/tau